MAARDITAFEYMVGTIGGSIRVGSGVYVKAGRNKLSVSQAFFENDNEYSFTVQINGRYLAIVWPDQGIAEVAHDSRLVVDYVIDQQVRNAFHRAGYVNMGEGGDSHVLGGKMQVWKRRPQMYMSTTQDDYPRSVDGNYAYDPSGFAWSEHCSAVIPGVNGHLCTSYIPPKTEGYDLWAVEYQGPHEYATFGEIGTMHTFGSVRLLHKVEQEEPIDATVSSFLDASMWREGRFGFDDGPEFEGVTTGQTWNGWACPYFTKEVAEEVIAYLKSCDDLELHEDELALGEPTETPYGERYGLGFSSWAWNEF